MKKLMILALYSVFFVISAYSQTITSAAILFKDTSDSTYSLVCLEDPDYPEVTPEDQRWMILAYISEDAIIDPLDHDGIPSNDDIVSPYLTGIPNSIMGQVARGLMFGPKDYGMPLNSGAVILPAEYIGKYVYIRVFNAHRLEDATKYMVLSKPYKVLEPGPQIANIFPDYAWDTDPVWKWIVEPKTEHPCGSCTGGHGCQ